MHTFRVARALLCGAAALVWAAAPSAAEKRLAFVTGSAGGGNLGDWPDAGSATGLAAGDAICQARAAAAQIGNPTGFRAWLSTSTTDAYCHVRGQTGTKAAGCSGAALSTAPWYRGSGHTPFTGSLAELTGLEHHVFQPVLYDEDAVSLVGNNPEYWTGTSTFGTVTTGITGAWTCNDWTSSDYDAKGLSGHALAADTSWTAALGNRPCSDAIRLLCVESGASEVPDLQWSPASLVFETVAGGSGKLSTWPSAHGLSGLAAADEICRGAAAAAYLPAPSSFFAWLSTGTVSAASRLSSSGPFRRIDGLQVATSRTTLLTVGNQTPIHQLTFGSYDNSAARVWTGSSAAGLPKAETCGNWTDENELESGGYGRAGYGNGTLWSDGGSLPCSWHLRLLCFSNELTIFWDGFEYEGKLARWSASVR